jgi:hypothetical protein
MNLDVPPAHPFSCKARKLTLLISKIKTELSLVYHRLQGKDDVGKNLLVHNNGNEASPLPTTFEHLVLAGELPGSLSLSTVDDDVEGLLPELRHLPPVLLPVHEGHLHAISSHGALVAMCPILSSTVTAHFIQIHGTVPRIQIAETPACKIPLPSAHSRITCRTRLGKISGLQNIDTAIFEERFKSLQLHAHV